MSCQCRVAHVALFKQALSTVAVGKDPWATFIFTERCLVVHLATPDQCVTASVTVPKEVFSDYRVDETPTFVTGLGSLLDALSVCESTNSPYTRVLLAYPNPHGRLVVEVHEGDHVAQCTLLTRPAKDHILDLRFGDSACPDTVVLRADVGKEVISDLGAFGCDKVAFVFSADALSLHGLGSIHGAMAVEVPKGSDPTLGFEVNDTTLQPRYLMSHIAQAFGSTVGLIRSAARQLGGVGGGMGTQPGGGSTAVFFDPSMERLSVKVNLERQLMVVHHYREADISLNVRITVVPLSQLLEDTV